MMNTDEHIGYGSGPVQSGKTERNTALTALRERLEDGLAKARLTKTQLAARADLGRTTVQTAFQPNGPVPSAATVAALAQALKLSKSELLELRRSAVDGNGGPAVWDNSDDEARACPGRPIKQWNPHELEVHPAGPALITPGSKAGTGRILPGYVSRAHDRVLADEVHAAGTGSSALVMLVGSSSTGKTRACWEAVQPLAGQGWRLWHPFDPTRAEAAFSDLMRVGARTVVWLNEAQHYLGDVAHGERIAAAVHQLLTDSARGPVLILGTLWPEFAAQLTAQPAPRAPDPHSRARELLAGRTVVVPEAFDREALAGAAALAENGDRLLADALTRTSTDGRMTQDLAGAPELLRRHQQGTPAAQAILNTAMDARRLGVGLHLPQAFLTDAATDYLADLDYDQLPEDWAERAYAELAEPVHGKQAPLRRTGIRPRRRPPGELDSTTVATAAAGSGPIFRLADYLEQHGRTSRHLLCPPASFWHAAHAHLISPDDLNSLANAAQDRHRLQWAHHLRYRAAATGSTHAQVRLAELAQFAGDRDSAEAYFEQAAEAGNTIAMVRLAKLREASENRVVATVLEEATTAGDAATTDVETMMQRSQAQARQMREENVGAEAWYQRAANAGAVEAMMWLARAREKRGDREGAEALYQQAADNGDTSALVKLVGLRERHGDIEGTGTAGLHEPNGHMSGAETLYQHAADNGDIDALLQLARARERRGDNVGAASLYEQAVNAGAVEAMMQLARAREKRGDREGAEALYQQAADNGDTSALVKLVGLRERHGDLEGAEALAHNAATSNDTEGFILLAQMREGSGDEDSAESLYQEAVNAGDTAAMVQLAQLWEKRGDAHSAERLVQRAADLGHTAALVQLAHLREGLGDLSGADALYLQAADTGRPVYTVSLNRWPWGLDPDGTPTVPWERGRRQRTTSPEGEY
ncbi:SEL1-like repeat protein [Streptomyces glycanivorans]|uniref:Helix-turn-helix domain-containing protein n=1 Tax=Streptomyces glycanivorans TaxID=3033808 RepID=A0ABY9JNZ9_9ACTN|nr:helix-turn-helix domain-containing protein [Streptomyces sp. Alt3]WLQ69382.1 helix-turn-helix domain-containing protein [Streptomyces sp. Alt3]